MGKKNDITPIISENNSQDSNISSNDSSSVLLDVEVGVGGDNNHNDKTAQKCWETILSSIDQIPQGKFDLSNDDTKKHIASAVAVINKLVNGQTPVSKEKIKIDLKNIAQRQKNGSSNNSKAEYAFRVLSEALKQIT